VKVVSDTSPICYLLLIQEIDLLPALYDRIYIPETVASELGDPQSPSLLRRWIQNPPAWLEVATSFRRPQELESLDAGERDVILLAEDLSADLVILDDRRARDAALKRGLEVTGLLGVLGEAAERQMIFLPHAFGRLQKTNFRVSTQVLKTILDRHSR
jgi:predicted nucleic acid-binding protein